LIGMVPWQKQDVPFTGVSEENPGAYARGVSFNTKLFLGSKNEFFVHIERYLLHL
jgi:hypothetical protein